MINSKIDKYLMSTCLLVIDEFNQLYRALDKDKLQDVAINDYSDIDLIMRLAYPLRLISPLQIGKKASQIRVQDKGLLFDVKYLQSYKDDNGAYKNKYNWEKDFQKHFDWVSNRSESQPKEKAFVIGWFNYVASFSELVPFGGRTGKNPTIKNERISYFKFLSYDDVSNKIDTIHYNYNEAYKTLDVSNNGNELNSMFFGGVQDKFHIAMYW